jgi:hypothetical protein
MITQCSEDQYLKNFEKGKERFPGNFCDCQKLPFDAKGDGSLEEHLKVVKKLAVDTETIICYGLGLGLFFLAAKKWLKKERGRRLIFLEETHFSLNHFFRSSLAHEILHDSQVEIYFLEGENFLIKKIAWDNVLLKVEVVMSPFNTEKGLTRFLEIKEKITNHLLGVNLLLGDYSDFGLLHFQNVLKNLEATSSLFLSSDLKGRFKNIPAIICGAGPSIAKSKDILKGMEKKALIFSGGAALNILQSANIFPHFAANIDKRAPNTRFEKIKGLSVPHFLQLQMSHENYLSVSTDKILLPHSGSYPLEGYLYESLGLSQEMFEIGWTVGSALVAITTYLGCNPIIFIGLDFCYTANKYPENIPSNDQIEIVETKDIFGNRVFSQKDWLLAKNWIEDLVKEKREKISFINCSEGILSKDIPSMTLEEASHLLDEGLNIDELVEKSLFALSKRMLDKKEVAKVLSELKKSVENSLFLCEEKLKNIEALFSSNHLSFQEFEKEIFYLFHLFPLWNIFSPVIKREVINQKKGVDPNLALFLNQIIFYKTIAEKFLPLLATI